MQADRLYEARVLLEGAIDVALSNERYASALRAMNNLGVVLESLDEFAVSESRVSEGLALARRVGNRQWEASLMGGTVHELSMLGRWDDAIAMATGAAAISTTAWTQGLLLDLVRVHCERGELGEARGVIESASATDESADIQTRVGRGAATAHLLRLEGSLDAALENAEQAFEQARAAFGPTLTFFKVTFDEVLECAIAAGRPERASELLALLDTLRPGQVTPQLRAIQNRYLGRLAAAAGEDGAAEALAVAERYYAELGMRFHAAAARLERAECLAAQGHAEEAAELIPAAREVFFDLKARPWLARTDAAQAMGSDPASAAVTPA
jgi:tetratricopeptide (TPR) repeat protein